MSVETGKPKDTDMKDASPKKRTELKLQRLRRRRSRTTLLFFFLQLKLMTPVETAKTTNAKYETARKWKTAYNKDPEKNVPVKKTNRASNRPASKLND